MSETPTVPSIKPVDAAEPGIKHNAIGEIRRIFTRFPIVRQAVRNAYEKGVHSSEDRAVIRASAFKAGLKVAESDEEKLDSTRSKLAEAEENSLIDSKTGLKNHRWFQQELSEKIAKAERHPEDGFWFLLMDYDDFKQFNNVDYAVGDNVLRVMSKVGNRPGEDIARWGGDEFGQIINFNITDADAVTVATRNAQAVYDISQEVLSADEDARKAGVNSATVSIALVKYQPGMTAESMLKIASKLLKEAKANEQKDTILVTIDGGAISQEHHRQI